eukprot:6205083-Pleurochrysis_carterae.AAC.5
MWCPPVDPPLLSASEKPDKSPVAVLYTKANFVMPASCRKCAMLIQARWRDHCGLPQPSMLELQEEMASLIQAAKRGRDVRKSIKNEKMANEYNQNRAAKVRCDPDLRHCKLGR